MRGEIICVFVLVSFSFSFACATSAGISPATFKEFFEPGDERSYTFRAFVSGENKHANISLNGDLAIYAQLESGLIKSGEEFTVTLNLPNELDKPGYHHLYVRVVDAEVPLSGTVAGISAIQADVRIFVPYPGKYAEASFEIENINNGEETEYILLVNNLGSEEISIEPLIEVYDGEGQKLITSNLDSKDIPTKNSYSFNGTLETSGFSPGEYFTSARIDYGEEIILNQSFKIGEYVVEIVDYDYRFTQGKINPLNILVQNKWNNKIEEVFAQVVVTDDGVVVGNTKTVSTNLEPWEIVNLTGYLDATNLESKRYLASISLNYANSSTYKLVAIYIDDAPKSLVLTYAIAVTSLIMAIVVSVIVYLFVQLRKLKKFVLKRK